MNRIKIIFPVIAREVLRISAFGALLALTGCERWISPQSGDQDAALGQYVVAAPIGGGRITVDPAKTSATTRQPLAVSVSCSGKNLPPDCDQNIPNWSFHVSPGLDFLSVQFANPSQPVTTATVTVDVQKYLKVYGNDQSAIGEHWFQVSVFPTSIPKNMTLGGKRDFTVVVDRVNDPGVRQEQTPEEPRLSGLPSPLGISISGTDAPNAVESGKLIYSGPLANLVDISITGPGRSKFTALSPTLPYIFRAGQSSVTFSVRFESDKLDFASYDANLIFRTDNNEVVIVPVTGRRTSF